MTSPRPKVAVLLAAYNGMTWLPEQLDSLLKQINVDLTIYVSVDLSSDGTFTWLKDMESRERRIEVLPYGERYGGAAANFFRLISDVDIGGYDFMAFSDQDDIWCHEKLHRATVILQGGQYSCYSSNVIAFWENGREVLINKAQKQARYDYLFESAGPGCTFVFNSKSAKALKNFVIENYSKIGNVWLHDWFSYSFARSHNFDWFIDPKPTMRYRQHGTNQVGANSGWHSFINRYKIMVSGDGFDKVFTQAGILGQNAVEPIRILKNPSLASFFRMIPLAMRCRRKRSEKCLMLFAVFIFCVKSRIKRS